MNQGEAAEQTHAEEKFEEKWEKKMGKMWIKWEYCASKLNRQWLSLHNISELRNMHHHHALWIIEY